ncbi:hypothetical protein [Macrococcoides canis]|uniref:hypothetical protein n=1 Tax=Macrococcoides canis TaxID=1855823 RepID=UPI0022B8A774|nr:hypothetical protein [Macrococcus canis]WBF52464.1 hypothetical protein LL975_10225 [Macrococcus canis]
MKKMLKFYLFLVLIIGFMISTVSLSEAATDKSKPVLKSTKINKITVYPGDNVQITASVTDKGTGVHQVSMNYMLPNSNKIYKINFVKKNATTFIGTLKLTDKSAKGSWNPVSLYVKDKAKNSVTYYNQYNNIYKKKSSLKNFSHLILSVKPLSNTKVKLNSITTESTAVTGTAKTDSIVYVLKNNKVIGSTKTINGKFKVNIPKQDVFTTIQVYSDFRSIKSSKVSVKVIPVLSNIDYYDPAIVNHIKLGQLNMIDGIKLNSPAEKYYNSEYYDIMDYGRYYPESHAYINFVGENMSDIKAYTDFPDNPLRKQTVDRFVGKFDSRYTKMYERNYILKLYGIPLGEDTYKTKDDEGDIIIDFYDNITFFYYYDDVLKKYYLESAHILGNELRSNPEKWKHFVTSYFERPFEQQSSYYRAIDRFEDLRIYQYEWDVDEFTSDY